MSTEKRTSDLWNYYDKCGIYKVMCLYCKKVYNHKSTSSNLRKHLRRKHANKLHLDPRYLSESEENGSEENAKKYNKSISRNNYEMIDKKKIDTWKYFVESENYIALCSICNERISYRSTVCNLKKHLLRKHIDVFNIEELLYDTSNEQEIIIEEVDTINENGLIPMYHYDSTLSHEIVVSTSESKQSPVKLGADLTPKVDFWKYFTKCEDYKARCSICENLISYKTTTYNLKKHLTRKHYTAFITYDPLFDIRENEQRPNTTELSRIDRPQQQQQQQQLNSRPSSNREERDENADRDLPELSAVTDERFKKLPMPTDECKSSNRKKASKNIESRKYLTSNKAKNTLIDADLNAMVQKSNRSLLNMFMQDYQPFHIIKDEGFSDVMKFNPRYELPTEKSISCIMIPTLYQHYLSTIKNDVRNEADSVSISIDSWSSSINAKNYLTVSAHYITTQYEFKSVLLRCFCFRNSSHTTSVNFITAEIENLLAEYNLLHKVNFVVYAGENDDLKTALEHIFSYKRYDCYANRLNSIVTLALTAEQSVRTALDKIRKTVHFFKINVLASDKLFKFQLSNGAPKPKYLIQDVPGCWTTTLYMLRRFLELEEQVNITIKSLGCVKLLPTITAEEYQMCHQICNVLNPFEEITKALNEEKYMKGSSVIANTKCLHRICEKLSRSSLEVVRRLTGLLRDGLINAFHDTENNDNFAMCALLDPRYKVKIFQKDSVTVKKLKQRLLNTVENMLDAAKETRLSTQSTVSEPDQLPASAPDSAQSADHASTWKILCEVFEDPESSTTERTVIKKIDIYVKNDNNASLDGANDNRDRLKCEPMYPVVHGDSIPQSKPANEVSAWKYFDQILSVKESTAATQTLSTADKAKKEIDAYFDEPILPRLDPDDKPNCPINWWKKNQNLYPNLAEIFRLECNVVATSVPCHKIFSLEGLLENDKRARLSKNVEMLIFLNANANVTFNYH